MIEFQNVTYQYKTGNLPAINDLTARINDGEFVFLVGHSGAGKSTILKMLIREVNPQKGKILVDGKDITRLWRWSIPALRRNFGVMFQDYQLLANKTVYENVAFAMEVLGTSQKVIKRRVMDALDMVGIPDKMNSLPGELSGGEQQRTAIARAIINNPKYLLADEPTGNLDPALSLSIMEVFQRINLNGTTVIVSTHEKEIVNQMQKRVLHIKGGILANDRLRGQYDDDFTLLY